MNERIRYSQARFYLEVKGFLREAGCRRDITAAERVVCDRVFGYMTPQACAGLLEGYRQSRTI